MDSGYIEFQSVCKGVMCLTSLGIRWRLYRVCLLLLPKKEQLHKTGKLSAKCAPV